MTACRRSNPAKGPSSCSVCVALWLELAPYDDLFSTEESRQDAKLEKVREIPLSELHPFKGHPFKVKDDEAMMETADSVRQYGVPVSYTHLDVYKRQGLWFLLSPQP